MHPMAENPAIDYGFDIGCPTRDADDLFSEVSGLDLLVQDTIHVLTADDFLGEGGDGRGYDTRKLMGATTEELAGLQAILEDVIERDDRILKATVVITTQTEVAGFDDISLDVSCTTTAGPFRFTKTVAELTAQDFEDQVS